MTLTLGIDTSHHVAVGLARDGEALSSLVLADTRAHGESLVPMIQQLCTQAGIGLADVDEYVVGMGPGPFTGLRVGIVAARTLASVAGRPVHGVCSLDVIAARHEAVLDEFVVASDARRKELYWARYVNGARVGEPCVTSPDRVPTTLPLFGPVPEQYGMPVHDPAGVDPAVLASRWATLPPVDGEPYYLRPADAAEPTARKSALPRLRLPR
ncbi:tRNA (adenosine(37)-N6)-threonylcarbamoyltransferase complex dimerization subunit type 1 TsaB [Arachnia propionica]|uniref:tRNA (Adenosine(37)-N6)-threonylcarbamoyltransferase complex dimerization subunit type 1 TsaB n=1 Tax=Arachnia propionica TaxID=1750 RepID=A0A3P1WT24_9ACTN|nr:tRNA (adenosine(37)-N6)-threonylcarbamoyltransferase complex dimerization subunit type 1 TsaB [Arachnia propionica]RRD49704.1 tRNA (adenosine(37)-N6)-threonylcarbamoyltransferase complex dimerization subunit type 1 TsaB [Arachnia propionica]